jgi:hypothetical protein
VRLETAIGNRVSEKFGKLFLHLAVQRVCFPLISRWLEAALLSSYQIARAI